MASTKNVSESEILKYYKDLSFPGAFRGIKTFQTLLKSEKDIDISEKKLYQILRKEPIYLIHQIKRVRPKTRPYIVHNYGSLCQADLGYMFSTSEDSFKYFLLLIDVYSSKLFVSSCNVTGSAN